MSSLQCSCLCGGVIFTLPGIHPAAHVCHCDTCRKWTGGPLYGVHASGQPDFIDSSTLKVFATSTWAERGFCGECGTHLFYRIPARGHYIVSMGALSSVEGISVQTELFIEKKQDNYMIGPDTRKLTGKELFAQFGNN